MRPLIALAALLLAAPATAALDPPEWTEPTAPFRIADNLYYVGTKGLAAYLVRTRDGLILIDGTMAENVPAIERSIAMLGFRIGDVRLLLNTHAHFDHAAGLAALKRDSKATLAAMPAEREALESGRPPSETSYGVVTFPAVKVDRLLADGQPVRLGGVALTPLLTPGHTPGCTSWTIRTTDAGRAVTVMFPCSITVAGNKLVGNRGYPGIVGDFRRSFARLAGMDADIVLPAHPDAADVIARGARRQAGDQAAFAMRGVLPKLVAAAKAAFDTELAKQEAAARR